MVRLTDLGYVGTLLDTVKSDTTDQMYELRWNMKTGYNCECPGFQSSKRKPKTCKHIKRYQFKYEVDNLIQSNKNLASEAFLKIAKETWSV